MVLNENKLAKDKQALSKPEANQFFKLFAEPEKNKSKTNSSNAT